MNQQKAEVFSHTEDTTLSELMRYLTLLTQRWWMILLAAVLAAAVGYLITLQIPAVYQTSTTLLINASPSEIKNSQSSIQTSQRLTTVYSEVMLTSSVLEKVIARIGIGQSPSSLAKLITVKPIKNTQLVVITVRNEDPGLAAVIANALAITFSEHIQESSSDRLIVSTDALLSQIQDMDTQITKIRQEMQNTQDNEALFNLQTRLKENETVRAELVANYEQAQLSGSLTLPVMTQIEHALIPKNPISPNMMKNVLMAALAGLVLSTGGIILFDRFDDTVRNPGDVERKLHLPVMGIISHFDEPEDTQLIAKAEPHSATAESFRLLRTKLRYASVDHPVHTLIVTSAVPAEGKTTVISNLAVVIAQSGQRVTVVDADFYRPRMHSVFDTRARPGLSGLFIKPTLHLNGSFQSTSFNTLKVISAGHLPPNPSELLGTRRMSEILSEVGKHSDIILVDTPPVLSVNDAVVLAPLVDGVLLVVKLGKTKISSIKMVVEQLRYVRGKIIGVVLNDMHRPTAEYGYLDQMGLFKKHTNNKKHQETERFPDPVSFPDLALNPQVQEGRTTERVII